MPLSNPTPEQEEPSLSLREAIGLLKGSAGEYFSARKELIQIEAKEASYFVTQKILIAIVAAVMGLFTYGLFWLVVISIGAFWIHGKLGSQLDYLAEWAIVGGAVLAFHVIVLLILVKKLKEKAGFELFAMTKSELKKDKEWLEENR